MGTHSIIECSVVNATGKTCLVKYFTHWDGHFESLGTFLADFLTKAVITNGKNNVSNNFNGAGDLFAQLPFLLTSYSVYVVPMDSEPEEYNYQIIVNESSSTITFCASTSWEETHFEGCPTDFPSWVLNLVQDD